MGSGESNVLKYSLLFLWIILIYISSINLVSNINFDFSFNILNQSETVTTSYGTTEKVGVGNIVGVTAKKERWYGTIIQENNNKRLNIFKFIPVPVHKNGLDFLYVHVGFLILSIMIIPLYILFERRIN